MTPMIRADGAPRHAVLPPFWLPLLAGLLVGASLAAMVLPDLGRSHVVVYRLLYLALYLCWTVPLAALQRSLWRRAVSWWPMAAIVFSVTYAMAVVNNAMGMVLGLALGWDRPSDFHWPSLFGGLESCWLALMAFSASHAVIAYYFELREERARHAQARAAARDAQLHALRLQLQPHFLFNTLNAISALVAEERGHEARTMIARLGDFLRATLEAGQAHEVTLAEELACAENYLDIERARLGPRLRVKWQLGADVLAARVPALLLQPLIENAIRHGIAPRWTPGRLDISITRADDRLCIRMENDTCEAHDTLTMTGDTAAPGHSIGLRNLAERLDTLYPQDHSLHAAPGQGGGFAVELALPYRVGEFTESATAGTL
jgi:two-component system sensor histidine kinase AlgZ